MLEAEWNHLASSVIEMLWALGRDLSLGFSFLRTDEL